MGVQKFRKPLLVDSRLIPELSSPEKYFTIFDDFLANSYTNPISIWTTSTAGTAGITNSSSNITVALESFGVAVVYASTVGAYTSFRTNAAALLAGAVGFDLTFRIRTPSLSTVSQEFASLIGIGDNSINASADATNNGAYFKYDRLTDGDVWTCITRNGSDGHATIPTNETRTVTAIAPSNTFKRLRVVVDSEGTFAKFFINDVEVAQHLTNIPTTPAGVILKVSKSAGTSLRSMQVDYFKMHVDASNTSR